MNRQEKRRKLVILIFLIKYFKIFFNLLSCLLAFKFFNAFFFSSKGMPVMASVWRWKISAPAGWVTYTNIGGGERGGEPILLNRSSLAVLTPYIYICTSILTVVYSTAYNPLVICISMLYLTVFQSISWTFLSFFQGRGSREKYMTV